MSPTLVLQNNLPIIALGAAGGSPKIISQVVLELVLSPRSNMSPQQAISQRAFTSNGSPMN